jgi:hypothetical protein
MDAPVTAIRGKDWIYTALWSSCGPDSQAPRCIINVPLTFLFKDGQPHKAVITDIVTGYVKRVLLEDIPIDRTVGESGFKGENFKKLRLMRQVLLDYQSQCGYALVQSQSGQQEPVLCSVNKCCVCLTRCACVIRRSF